ncbi:trehalase-like domain-containing protein, partial [Henriciella sp.]|uniref:trehalase-like domain-containing protein n=1 Tax=Henriciella sp. TaxID=1968823 RepID=UPI0017F64E71
MSNLELGIIGNGTVAGLIDEHGECVWMCLPRLDGEPVFNSLLGGRGKFAITLQGHCKSTQRYRRNTAVIETELEAEDGSAIRITDYCPRFMDKGRMFRPASMVRRITPLRGMPRIRVDLFAQSQRGDYNMVTRRGVNHIKFLDENAGFRVTTDAPVSYVMDG